MMEGEKLVRDFFEKFSKQQWDDVDRFIHPAFQSVHQDGARNKEEEIKTLKNPAGRLSVFVKSPDGWKWLAHANLIAIANRDGL